MAGNTGWYVAIGALGLAALWKSQRPGEMTAERDRIYRECLTGRVPAERMRIVARAFERARCFPQARMLRLRADLKDLPPEVQAQRRESFERGMNSRNRDGILKLAMAFEEQGATTSAAKLRRHAEKLPKPTPLQTVPEAPPIVTPPPAPEATASDDCLTSDTLTNGVSHVAVSQAVAN